LVEKSRKKIGYAVSYLQEPSNQEMALRGEEIDSEKARQGMNCPCIKTAA